MTWIFLSPAALRMTSNSSFSSAAASPPPRRRRADGGHCDGSGGGDAELFLERLQELVQLEDRHVLEDVEQLGRAHGCHCCFSSSFDLGSGGIVAAVSRSFPPRARPSGCVVHGTSAVGRVLDGRVVHGARFGSRGVFDGRVLEDGWSM